jgi:hypothetical protein
LAQESSEEVPKDVSPDKRCRVDFVGSFPSSKRIQRAFVPHAQDCNQRNENFQESDKCSANVNAAEDKGKIFALDVSLNK